MLGQGTGTSSPLQLEMPCNLARALASSHVDAAEGSMLGKAVGLWGATARGTGHLERNT